MAVQKSAACGSVCWSITSLKVLTIPGTGLPAGGWRNRNLVSDKRAAFISCPVSSDCSESHPSFCPKPYLMRQGIIIQKYLIIFESLSQIHDDVFRCFQANRDTHNVISRPGCCSLFFGKLAMRGRGRMEYERTGIADIRKMAQ